MKISVIIPAFNAARTIRETLNTALSQTLQPFEILVYNDGSTDATGEILRNYSTRVVTFSGSNRGVAHARNYLIKQASGDIIALLDADDLWHNEYLMRQSMLILKYPTAVAAFLNHTTFSDSKVVAFQQCPNDSIHSELIQPLAFLRRFHESIGPFMCPSFCCIPQWALKLIGDTPFREDVSWADDYYLFNLLPTIGPVAFNNEFLGAYRISVTSQSSNKLKCAELASKVMDYLLPLYREPRNYSLYPTFIWAMGVERRNYSRLLLATGQASVARDQLQQSLREGITLQSHFKSLLLYLATWLPVAMRPRWAKPRSALIRTQ